MDKNKERKLKLRKCSCGGDVYLTGGTCWEQEYSIVCDKCGGRWNMNTYSLEEAAERWGLDRS